MSPIEDRRRDVHVRWGHILSLAAITATISACDKLRNTQANIHPLASSQQLSGNLPEEDITDPNALFEALKRIQSDGPPQDHHDPSSEKRWASTVDSARKSVLGHGEFILPITCGPKPGYDQGNLSYSEGDKNLHVRVYNVTKRQKGRAEQVVMSLKSVPNALLENAIQSMLTGSGRNIDLPYTRGREDNPSGDKLIEDDVDSNSVVLQGGKLLRMENDPLTASGSELRLLMARADQEQATNMLAISEGKQPDTQKTGAETVQKILMKWYDYPKAFRKRGSWADIPYAGNPIQACLFLRVANIDLATGGRWGHLFTGQNATLTADALAWYVVDKASRKIISQAKIDAEPTTAS